ncbi:MAG: hypothetical protein WBW71_02500 [Bacteroidota bacterium]
MTTILKNELTEKGREMYRTMNERLLKNRDKYLEIVGRRTLQESNADGV